MRMIIARLKFKIVSNQFTDNNSRTPEICDHTVEITIHLDLYSVNTVKCSNS